ncbi:PEP-CTERM sorting domain-containing protein [Prosthecobacter sp.]|uniref:PEP-CTERM sorting domain-containing protein n=1 Tax=Prosthecobacter sp. TaxID=1965333 RepID=UPI001D3CA495|nr:PEP-CTERM sorting domain-containing protein [Prosthecobacter sp.]MCB1279105.1 PEP-CTERM sorting domain-containing protein [Prosthecobacter sp.]
MHSNHHPRWMPTGALTSVLSLFLILATLPLQASVTITDSFTNGGVHADGTPLNGDSVEFSSSGSYTWTAGSTGGGGYNTSGGAVYTNATGANPGPGGDTVTRLAWVDSPVLGSERAVLSLDVTQTNNPSTVSWSSISLFDNPGATFDSAEWNTGVVTLRLMNTGEYEVRGLHYGFNSQDLITAGSLAPGFNVGGSNNLLLDFDNATNLLSASINGVSVLSSVNPFGSVANPGNGSYEPNITAAGFHMYAGDVYGSSADNFSLFITDAVPEPGRALLACLGLTTCVLRRRRTT